MADVDFERLESIAKLMLLESGFEPDDEAAEAVEMIVWRLSKSDSLANLIRDMQPIEPIDLFRLTHAGYFVSVAMHVLLLGQEPNPSDEVIATSGLELMRCVTQAQESIAKVMALEPGMEYEVEEN